MAKYVFRNGARIRALDAQTVGESLEALRKQNDGFLTPQYVVDASAPKDAPLHDAFEWDDEIAANAFRNKQARNLIQSVRVVVKESANGVQETQRLFINIKEMGEDNKSFKVYHNFIEAMASPDKRKLIMRQAYEDLRVFRDRYLEIADVKKVFDLIDQASNALLDEAS